MWETIREYWLNCIMGAIAALLTAAWGWCLKRIKDQQKVQEAQQQGTLALLKDRLFQSCLHYIEKGYCDVHSRESLEALYLAYSAMGGNGTGKQLYETVCKLPFTKGEMK